MTSSAAAEARRRRPAARAGGIAAAVAVVVAAGCGTAGAATGHATGTAGTRTAASAATVADPVGTTGTAAGATATSDTATSDTATSDTATSDTAMSVAGNGGSAGAPTVGAAAAHLPAGFAVDAVAAVSARTWWAVGTGGDGSLALTRTTDGGRSWSRPVLPAALSRPVAGGLQPPGLAFSTALDGSIVTAAGAYWVTTDGGLHWRAGNRSGAPVLALAATPDASVVVMHSAAGYAVARATAGAVGLTTVLGAGRLTTTTPSVATFGRTVVVVSGDRHLISTDDGRTFASGAGPCIADLGGWVAVAGTTVVAWCATGMDGSGWVSTDGGRHFAPLPGAAGANSTAAAPTGGGATVAWADPERGVHLRAAAGPATGSLVYGRAMLHVTWIGFTGATDGFALASATATGPTRLWRTVDGGHSWHLVDLG